MSDKQLEHIIKQTLADYKPDVQPDWEQFKAAYKLAQDAETLSQAELDMRTKLQEYQSDASPQWSAFLAKREVVRLEEDINFIDDQVKSKLDNHTTNKTPDWSAFQDFKSNYQTHKATVNFDQEVREKVELHRAAGVAPWAAFLAYRLNHVANIGDQDFDSRIQDELHNYETDATPQWDAFKSYRDNSSQNEPDQFDQILKDKLDNYESSVSVDWSSFVSRQQSAKGNTATFDRTIVEKLDGYQTSKSPQWDKLLAKKRMSDAVYANGQFDNSVSQAVRNYTRRYNSAHWLQLKDRLEKIALVRKQIFTFKAMEIVFVCLMAFTLGNHLKYLTGYKLPAEPIVSIDKKNDNRYSASTDNLNDTKLNQVADHSSQSRQTVEKTSDVKSEYVTSGVSNGSSTSSGYGRTASTGSIGNSSIGGQTDILGADTPVLNESSTIAMPVTSDREIASPESPSALAALIKLDGKGLYSKVTSLESNQLPETRDLQYYDSRAKQIYNDEGNWWHIFNSIDNYYITTPDRDGLADIMHVKFGYSLEVLHSWQRKNWEIETGLGYSFVNYEPIFEDFTYEFDKQLRFLDFEEIRLDLITAPLNVKYHFISNGRWSVFGGVGLDNNLISRTEYGIVDSVVMDLPRTCPIGQICEDQLPDFYNNEFTSGLFGQAPITEVAPSIATRRNAYLLRGSLSIGAERNVSDNFAVYLRSTYAHTLYDNGGVGPFGDELNRLTFGMGFKMRLK